MEFQLSWIVTAVYFSIRISFKVPSLFV